MTEVGPDPTRITHSELVGGTLEAAEAAVFETFVVPRYLRAFGELAVSMLASGDDAQVAHIDCRTGYPDVEITRALPGVAPVWMRPVAVGRGARASKGGDDPRGHRRLPIV